MFLLYIWPGEFYSLYTLLKKLNIFEHLVLQLLSATELTASLCICSICWSICGLIKLMKLSFINLT